MAVLKDFKCEEHGYFESRNPKCPMKACHAEVYQVFLQAPGVLSNKTKFTDKSTKQLAMEFGMSNIKTTRAGEHQTGYLTRNNKFSEAEYAEAEKYAKKIEPTPPIERIPQTPQEARPGDSAIWGGGMKGIDMQSILAGRFATPVRDENVGLRPTEAGISHGPKTASYIADQDNLQIKP